MSSEKNIKKIDLNVLDQAEKKVSIARMKKVGIAAALILFLVAGSYGVFAMLSGKVIGSRLIVNNMNCPACVVTVKEVTGKLPGVVEADVSLAAQDVTVKFRDKQTNTDQIREAIAKAGYPVKLEGLFSPEGSGISEPVIAGVNGKPVFAKDLNIPLLADMSDPSTKDPAAAFFNTVGKEVLLQIADSKTVVVQPYEVEAEVERIRTAQGIDTDEFAKRISQQFGSKEKYFQIVAQRLGIRKLVDEHVVSGIQDSQEKARKTMEWVGTVFKDADVKILDPTFKEKMHASFGQDEWKTFWPRMISANTELKNLLVQ
ncbi:heavy-metal-associated domain-containing protein [Desulfomonile tiedjei]|uniref:Copper chaperone n=1 Tax=Desulfomonile tiedjei (strain ATCC 49306 / DSM 6799 / DCB-1) TaxID=706587 RepID=I4CC21_DESTA|nr:heavy-metal-associated domain-containing protein [Desulfomonile tiedjei]AFM27112.1 copper chaperone [Desulfomonile tiedjei DSM 6799]